MIENKMIACETHAIRLEDSGHNFTNKNGPTNRKPSPKKAKSGIYYMNCLVCGRSVFLRMEVDRLMEDVTSD